MKATIEALGVIGNGETEIVIRSDEKHQPVFFKVERMGLESVVDFINSLTKQ
jgi:hypothetical protein